MALAKSNAVQRGRSRKTAFNVGDAVQFVYMSAPIQGKIVEDRGAIGIGGRRLYRVIGNAGSVERILELSDEELQKVSN